MKSKKEVINNLLVVLFNNILTIEERALKNGAFKNLTISELHVIEAIGTGDPINMSTLASRVGVTVGTLTISINNLVRKDYVVRERFSEDRRVVLVALTEKGKEAFAHHEAFHDEMVEYTMSILDDSETDVLVNALSKITIYFEEKYQP